jgi:hypothetical protein
MVKCKNTLLVMVIIKHTLVLKNLIIYKIESPQDHILKIKPCTYRGTCASRMLYVPPEINRGTHIYKTLAWTPKVKKKNAIFKIIQLIILVDFSWTKKRPPRQ